MQQLLWYTRNNIIHIYRQTHTLQYSSTLIQPYHRHNISFAKTKKYFSGACPVRWTLTQAQRRKIWQKAHSSSNNSGLHWSTSGYPGLTIGWSSNQSTGGYPVQQCAKSLVAYVTNNNTVSVFCHKATYWYSTYMNYGIFKNIRVTHLTNWPKPH